MVSESLTLRSAEVLSDSYI